MSEHHHARILIVDDHPALRQLLTTLLQKADYCHIHAVSDGKTAQEALQMAPFDLVLLDVMLPDIDGFSLYPKLQAIQSVPVIFLSAQDEDVHKLKGLGLGADDYITKPFLPEELLLRVSAVLRRTLRQADTTVTLGKAMVDLGNLTVCNGERTSTLTATEFAIFQKLYQNRGNIVTMDQLCAAVWQDGDFGYENTLMVHIRRLREKIEATPSAPTQLRTVRGLGYRLAREGEE